MSRKEGKRGFAAGRLATPAAVVIFLACIGCYVCNRRELEVERRTTTEAAALLEEISSNIATLERADGESGARGVAAAAEPRPMPERAAASTHAPRIEGRQRAVERSGDAVSVSRRSMDRIAAGHNERIAAALEDAP